MSVVVVFAVLTAVASGWALICNERTYRQRTAMLMALRPGELSFAPEMARYRRVTYNQHFLSLLVCRSAERLYGDVA